METPNKLIYIHIQCYTYSRYMDVKDIYIERHTYITGFQQVSGDPNGISETKVRKHFFCGFDFFKIRVLNFSQIFCENRNLRHWGNKK